MTRITASLILGLAVSIAPTVSGQVTASDYDLTTPVTLKGQVSAVGGFGPSAHVYIRLDVQDANAKTVQWAIEGDSIGALLQAGWKVRPPNETLRIGQEVSALVYLPK